MFEVIELGGMKTVTTRSTCNHVYIVDVSGSMYGDLPKIRQDLKNTISLVAQPEDTFSLIYFSGRGQCGVVFENVLVRDISTIGALHAAIDRFIQPIGLTGFFDPIKLAMALQLDPTKVNNFVMMTDGYDNQSNRAEVVKLSAELPSRFQSVSFIEYGYYADRDMIAKMAEAANGTHIFAEGFTKYEQVFRDVVSGTPRVPNIEVKVNKAAKDCIYVYGNNIHIVSVVDGVVHVPEDVERVHSIVPKDVLSKRLSEDHLYMVLFYAAKKGRDELVWNVLQMLGDVALVKKYSNAFTKQELSAFESMVEDAVLKPETRFSAGKDLNAVPDKNAPTIVELLRGLAINGAELVIDSPYWEYNRIGRASVAQDALPRFIPSPMSRVSMNDLVFSSERPNVSISTALNGMVELPENEFGLKSVKSHIFRNYTIIKDGIVNVAKLPVVVDESTYYELEKFQHEVLETHGKSRYVVFDLSNVPVINRGMVESVKQDDLVRVVTSLNRFKADLKVLKYKMDELGGSDEKIRGLSDEYGSDAAAWLSSIGVRDYGFSPVNTKQAEATDEYESIQLSVKVKGLSSLPAISAVEKKLNEKKKLTTADILINDAMVTYSTLVDMKELQDRKVAVEAAKRTIEERLAGIVYSLILGRKWFGDSEVISDVVDFGSCSADVTFEKVRKMVAI